MAKLKAALPVSSPAAGKAADNRGLLALQRSPVGIISRREACDIGDILAQGERTVDVEDW